MDKLTHSVAEAVAQVMRTGGDPFGHDECAEQLTGRQRKATSELIHGEPGCLAACYRRTGKSAAPISRADF